MLNELIEELRQDCSGMPPDNVVRQSILYNIDLLLRSKEYDAYVSFIECEGRDGSTNDALLTLLLYDQKLKSFVDVSQLKSKYDHARVDNVFPFRMGADVERLFKIREEMAVQLASRFKDGYLPYNCSDIRMAEQMYLRRAAVETKLLSTDLKKVRGNEDEEALELELLSAKMVQKESDLSKILTSSCLQKRKKKQQPYEDEDGEGSAIVALIVIIMVIALIIKWKSSTFPMLSPEDSNLLTRIRTGRVGITPLQ